MSKSLLEECTRAAQELGALMNPPATIEVNVQHAVRAPKRSEDAAGVIAMARVASVPASHQRVVQAESMGASEQEALAFLKASLELKLRFLRSGSSGTRSRGTPQAPLHRAHPGLAQNSSSVDASITAASPCGTLSRT